MSEAHVGVLITVANIAHANSFNFIMIARCTVRDLLRTHCGSERRDGCGEKKGTKQLVHFFCKKKLKFFRTSFNTG